MNDNSTKERRCKAVAIIPARGGSKRIPRKNVRLFAGKPAICYSVDLALKSNLFDSVIVSTDDAEIMAIATKAGATAPFLRPPELSNDHATTWQVMNHAVGWLKANGQTFDYVCCLYPIVPLLEMKYLITAFEIIKTAEVSYVYPVVKYTHPIQRALKMLCDRTIVPLHPDVMLTRTQDIEPTYHDAGQFYLGTTSAFLNDNSLYQNLRAAAAIELPKRVVHDIDDQEDWQLAEVFYERSQRKDTDLIRGCRKCLLSGESVGCGDPAV